MNDTTDDEMRFPFGKNWTAFIASMSEQQALLAEQSIKDMLNMTSMKGMRVLDVGCGSGLFSLAAIRLGAQEVVSFDLDTNCIACAQHLKENFTSQAHWEIRQGSVLDQEWITEVGSFDVVYSWGVLHHTGAMWQAFENVTKPVVPGGILFISIYNDQGILSRFWRVVKKIYNRSSRPVQLLLAGTYHGIVLVNRTVSGIFKRQPFGHWYRGSYRGMSLWHDTVDWVGGYPFETASQQEITDYFHGRGFSLQHIRRTSGSGCNEFVFKKTITIQTNGQ